MIEGTDAPQGGAEGEVTSEAVESISEATTEQQTEAVEHGQADDAGEATEEPKRVPWFQKRIDEVTAKRYEAEREAAYWRGLAEANKRPEAAPQPEPAVLPTLEQFNWDESQYQAALAKHFEEKTAEVLDKRLSEREQKATEEQKNNSALSKLREGEQKHPDFMAAVSAIPANEAIRDFLLEEPAAVDVLYQLGKDQAATERFYSLSPVQQAMELGRRAALATVPQSKSKAIAPPPPQTVAGMASGMTKPAEQMSPAEYNAWREQGGGR